MLATLALAVGVIALSCGRRETTLLCGEERLGEVSAARRVDVPGGQPPLEARVAALASGWLVVWSAGDATDSDLWVREVDAYGVATGAEVPLTLLAGKSDNPRVALGPGGIAIAWRDDRNGRNDAWATVIGSAGQPAFPALFQTGVFTSDQDPRPAIAALGTAWAVVWNGPGPDGHDHLYAQAMDASGAAIGAPVGIDAQQLDRATPPSAANVGGSLAVVDVESRPGATNPPDVFAYVLSPVFTPPFQRFAVEPADASGVEIAALGALGGIVWCSDSEVWFAAVDSAGVAHAEHRVAAGCSPAIAPAQIAFLASWVGPDGVAVAQALTPSGSADGRAIRLGEAVGRPDVAWASGRAAVVWTSPSEGVRIQPLGCTGP